ncbi:hypothetical protein [Alloactinosynnema sp. L-07]|nr:hypothetical protein [Alloactinosynnema sp. L-07]
MGNHIEPNAESRRSGYLDSVEIIGRQDRFRGSVDLDLDRHQGANAKVGGAQHSAFERVNAERDPNSIAWTRKLVHVSSSHHGLTPSS